METNIADFAPLVTEVKAAANALFHPHEELFNAAIPAIVAAHDGRHVLLEGPSGCGLSALADFVARFCARQRRRAGRQTAIASVLLGAESAVETVIGAVKTHSALSSDDSTRTMQR
jgi:sigma54-dependent transcription regulator